MNITFEHVTVRDIEALASWASAQKRPTSWRATIRRARQGDIAALKRIAKLVNDRKGPWGCK